MIGSELAEIVEPDFVSVAENDKLVAGFFGASSIARLLTERTIRG